MKKACKLLTVFLLAVTLGVLGNLESVNAKSKIKISNSKITLTVGQSKTLKVKGTKKKPKWSSSKKSVATVSKKGKVVAKKTGSATITAKIGKKKYKCKVKVIQKSKVNSDNRSPYLKNQGDFGTGNFYIYLASGTSENGKIPVLLINKGTPFGYVDYYITDLTEETPVKIYIDGKKVDETYVNYGAQASLMVTGNQIKSGTHYVEAVQYKNGNISFYRLAKYKVTIK